MILVSDILNKQSYFTHLSFIAFRPRGMSFSFSYLPVFYTVNISNIKSQQTQFKYIVSIQGYIGRLVGWLVGLLVGWFVEYCLTSDSRNFRSTIDGEVPQNVGLYSAITTFYQGGIGLILRTVPYSHLLRQVRSTLDLF